MFLGSCEKIGSTCKSTCCQARLSTTLFMTSSSSLGKSECHRSSFAIVGDLIIRSNLGISGKCWITLAGILLEPSQGNPPGGSPPSIDRTKYSSWPFSLWCVCMVYTLYRCPPWHFLQGHQKSSIPLSRAVFTSCACRRSARRMCRRPLRTPSTASGSTMLCIANLCDKYLWIWYQRRRNFLILYYIQ